MLYRAWMGRVAQSDLMEFTAEALAAVLPGTATLREALRDARPPNGRLDGVGDEMLRAFVTTVVPCASPEDPNLLRAFSDPCYSFGDYRDLLVADLCARSGSPPPIT